MSKLELTLKYTIRFAYAHTKQIYLLPLLTSRNGFIQISRLRTVKQDIRKNINLGFVGYEADVMGADSNPQLPWIFSIRDETCLTFMAKYIRQ